MRWKVSKLLINQIPMCKKNNFLLVTDRQLVGKAVLLSKSRLRVRWEKCWCWVTNPVFKIHWKLLLVPVTKVPSMSKIGQVDPWWMFPIKLFRGNLDFLFYWKNRLEDDFAWKFCIVLHFLNSQTSEQTISISNFVKI